MTDRHGFDDISEADIAAATARERWLYQAHVRGGKQLPDEATGWTQTIFATGRGFGKTRSIVEWQWWECQRVPRIIGHAVGPSKDSTRGIIFEGESGFRSVVPAECLAGESWDQAFTSSDDIELAFKNGSVIKGFGSTNEGGKLRGPQCHNAIGDELREWDHPKGNLERAYENLMLGLRLPYPDGTPARAVLATTPKAIPFLRALYQRPGVRVVSGTSYENIQNLSVSFKHTLATLEGTKIGKAEVYGEDVDTEEGGIFKRSWFRIWPFGKPLPVFSAVIMTMDTAFEDEDYDNKTHQPDYSACAVYGVFNTHAVFTEAERKKHRINSRNAIVLLDFWMDRIGFPELLERTRTTYREKYGSKEAPRYPDLVLIENKASGISLRQTLIKYGVPVMPFDPRGTGKTMRAHAASPYVLQGMFFVPESGLPDRKGKPRNWCEPLLDQMCSFAGEGSIQYDDALDCAVQGILYLGQTGTLQVIPERLLLPDVDEQESREHAEAARIAEREKRRGYSPYGV